MNHRIMKPTRLILIATTVLLAAALLSLVSRSSPVSRAAQDSTNPMGSLSAENTVFHPTTPPDADGTFDLLYDAEALHEDFSMLSLTAREGVWKSLADEVTIRFLAVGSGLPRAKQVTLIREQVFVHDVQAITSQMLFLPLIRQD